MITHPRNAGKGAAIRTAVDSADGDYMVILDADLEYDPQDIPRLLDPVLDGRATVVYGNRTFGSHSAYSFWYVMGNKAVTTLANVLFNSYIGDLETCFKLMPVALYRSLDVQSRGFGMEAEVTGKLLRQRIRPYEVPISYRARDPRRGQEDHLEGRRRGAVDPRSRAGPQEARPHRPLAADKRFDRPAYAGRVQPVPARVVARAAVPPQVRAPHAQVQRPVRQCRSAPRRRTRRTCPGQVGLDHDHVGPGAAPAARRTSNGRGVWV